MSKITINNKEYDVKLNKMFIQPHIIINDVTTDIGIWEDLISSREEEYNLLLKAAECYEYNKLNNTIVNSYYHMHKSEQKTDKIYNEHPQKSQKKKCWNIF